MRSTMAMISDSQERCLFWRTTSDGQKIAYFRKRIDRRDKWQSLGELSLKDARKLVVRMRQEHALGILNKKLGLVSMRSDTSSFAELFAAYDSYCAGIDIAADSAKKNKQCMGIILRRVRGEGFDVDQARVSEFTVQLLRDFSAATIRERKEKCAREKLGEEDTRKKIESAQRTIKSTVQQARSLFARAALQSRAYEGLTLPDMADVMKTIVGASTIKSYEPPAAEVVARIAADAAKLKTENPGLWLAFNLEVNSGLRRGSVRLARWDWFTVVEADDKGAPVVVDLRVGVAKGGGSVVRFDAGLYAEMLELKKAGKTGDTFILPGETVELRDEVCAALVSWLKQRGLNSRQPNHELRKLYGDRKYTEHGAEEAQRALGHSDPKLTSKVYASARARKALRVV